MKKLMLLFFSMLLLACVKPEPPAPPLVTYTISVSVTGKGEVVPDKVASVPLGESRTLVATADPDWAVYSAKSNSMVYEVPFLSTSYSFSITNINANQNASVVFVKKGDLFVSKDRWYMWSEENQYTENGSWYLQNVPAQMYTDYIVFTLEGKLSFYHSNGVIFGGPFNWSILGETLTVVNGTTYTIKTLDANKMVLEFTMEIVGGGHVHVRQTYYHTPKPLT